MCWEKVTDEFTESEFRVTETTREEELERPELRPEPVEEPEEVREREKEFAGV